MKHRQHIGLVGFGAIGADVHRRLSGDMRVTVMLRPASRLGAPASVATVASIEDLLAAAPDLVVEAAGQAALIAIAPVVLEAGIPLVAVSAGALADASKLAELEGIAERTGARLIVAAGAIGGLDYLTALRGAPGLAVCYTSRKPPAAWATELALMEVGRNPLTEAFVLFEGSAAEAAQRYPRNVNAGLAVALAAGAEVTRVRVIADPAVTLNIHEIEVESALGTCFMRFANHPTPGNPKTSGLTGASIAQAVRRYFSALVI